MAPRFTEWLTAVEPLITFPEQELFLRLRRDYQRDAFIREFWRVRDPYPETARNEARERWEVNLAYVRSTFGSISDARARVLLVHGRPTRRIQVRCSTTRIPAEIWIYQGSRTLDSRTVLVFVQPVMTEAEASLWVPGRSGSIEGSIRAARSCMNGALLAEVVAELRGAGAHYEWQLSRVLAKPSPRNAEWVTTFASETAELPEEAELFRASFTVDFLGRHRSRTVVQGTLLVDEHEAERADLAGYRSYEFDVVGEIVRDAQLLESFRYKFSIPTLEEHGTESDRYQLPIAFQRYVRPGDYTLALLVRDINANRYFRWEDELTVPRLTNDLDVASTLDEGVARIFREATAAVATGETSIRLVPPTQTLLTGLVRFDTVAAGSEIEQVSFLLDDRPLMIKNKPPFNVEIDLGPFPKPHLLRVVGLDASGREVADDELVVNAGSYRFSVSLIEPRPGRTYADSMRIRADVSVPENSVLERLDIYLDEELTATLYQEPFVLPVALPPEGARATRLSYVRAVAVLADGNRTEDVVFVNDRDLSEAMKVEFVELYASITDRSGEPVTDLDRQEVVVEEDGERQEIVRLERVEDLPIHVAVLIDNSASMRGALDTTRSAALGFLQQAIAEQDRAAVITFNRFPTVSVKATSDLRALGGGLAGLTAEGQTALYDSVMFGLYYFAGVSGQRALLVLSDGKDEVSRFSASETLEYARRAGVTVYTIGLGLQGNERGFLRSVAEVTGGRSFFVRSQEQLALIYAEIERDLRSQYLIAYQSSNTRDDGRFRRVQVRTRRAGSEVTTMTGYYP